MNLTSSHLFWSVNNGLPENEANLNIHDASFAAEQVKVFEEDKRKSRLMTRAEFKNRSKIGKLFEEIAGTLRRQL